MISVIIPGIKKRFRWRLLTGALFLFIVLAVLAFSGNLEKKSVDPLTAAERAWLKAHPVIRLAPDPDFPPVEYFDKNGTYSGITADYVALIENKLGIRIEIVRLRNWDEIISSAKSRKIDAYVATKTPQRAEYLLFTRPFLEFPVVILAREKAKGPLTLEKLHGMKVSVVSEYAAHNYIAYNHPKLHLDLVPDVQTGLRKVAFGLSDAFVENLATVTYYIEKGGITNLRIAGESGYFYRMGFCTRKDWPELNRILEKGLAEISADEQKAIYKKWIPVEPRSLFTSRGFQTGLVVAVAAILLIVAGFIAWNRALARQVRLRTGELENELAERKRIEAELELASDGLKKRVDERTGELAQTVQALRFTQFAVDRLTDQAFWMTKDGHFFYVNGAACHALGYTRDELLTMSVTDIDPACPPEMVDHYWQVLRVNGADTFEACHRAKDGRVYPVEIRSNLLIFEGKEYNCCFVTDIAQRKREEEALVESGARLKMAMDNAKLVQWEYDVESGMFTFDDQFYALYGTTAEREGGALMSAEDYVRKFIPPEESAIVSGGISTVLENSSNQLEHRIIRADGEERVIVVCGEAVRDEAGCIVKIRGANQDITERKRMEELLRKSEAAQRESESRVRRKLESILDPEGDTGELDLADILDAPEIQALMEDLYRITGLKMSIIDLQGQVLVDVGWQDICSRFHRNHPETLRKCHESDTDLTVGVPQGEFKTYRCKNNIWHIVTPIIVGGRHMGNLFLGQFFFADEQIDYDLFRAQARTYGFPEEEYLAALEAVPRQSEEQVNLGKAVFLRLTDMFSKLSYANIKLAHSLAERDRLTATLRQANMVVENSPVVLFRCKAAPGWPVELVSRNVVQFGYAPEEFLSGGLTYFSIVHPEDLGRLIAETEEYAATGEGQLLQEYRIVTKGGDIRWIINEAGYERNEEGEITCLEGIIIDVTEWKEAEEALREANLVVENSPVVLFRWKGDDEWPVELVSRNIIQFGYTPDEFLSGSITYSEVIHPGDLDRVTREVHDFCDGGTDQFRLEYRILTKEGDVRWVNEHANVERDAVGGVKNFEGIVIDVSERKRAEEELQRQKKLLQELNESLEKKVWEEVSKNRGKDIMLIQQNRQAALGEMLDHIAHQWKQPLTSLSLVIQDLGDTASVGELTDDHVKETVNITMSLLDHMTQTMDVFRGFYRPDKEKKVFSIKDSIDQALAFISPSFMFHSIAVEIEVDPGLTAFGYPKEYTQVVLNILANARDVFRKRGTEKPRVVIRAFAEMSKSVVTVTDNAGGIPEAIIGKIFDFYFTTNESNGGTGIGLPMSKNIIEKNMAGKLSAQNTNGGAQFRIEISLT